MYTMRDDTRREVIANLQRDYGFKSKGSRNRMYGTCPSCQHKDKEAWIDSDDPWVIICPRNNNCGARNHIKELYPELFTQFSKKHPPTPTDPKATANAYMDNGRQLASIKWKDTYTQELHQDYKTKATSPTVRFDIKYENKPVTFWERIIEPAPGVKKGHFQSGKEYTGLAWYPPKLDPYSGQAVLGMVKEIWLVEGIFDAMALAEHGIHAIATLTSGNFPDKTLTEITERMAQLEADKPKLVLAFDNDWAGRTAIHKLMPKAKQAGYQVSAVQTTEWATGKADWNDLHKQTMHSRFHEQGSNDHFSKEKIDLYRYYGDLLTAETPKDRALLIHNKWKKTSFFMFFNHSTYWIKVDVEGYNRLMEDDNSIIDRPMQPVAENYKNAEGKTDKKAYKEAIEVYEYNYTLWRDDIIHAHIEVEELMNCQPQALYFQQNLITDESWYFFRLRVPSQRKYDPLKKPIEYKNTFTGGQLSTASEFKKRLLSIAPGVIYTGDSHQLNKILANMISRINTVETIDFIGYSEAHQAYIFNKVAVKDGKTYDINKDDYYELGKTSVKTLANQPVFHIADKDKAPQANWLQDIITGWNMQGIIALTGFMGSLFAQQIRTQQKSFPFLEIIGEPATGKSTLISFFWRLLGRSNNQEGIDPNKATRAGRLRALSQVSNLPCVFIESDRENLSGGRNSQFDWDELKNLYDGGAIGTRGMKTSGNETYEPPFRGTIIISQNLPVVASKAILSRICHMCFTKERQTQDSENAARRIESLQSEDISWFLLDLLKKEKQYLQIFDKEKMTAETWLKSAGIKDFRVAHCHAQLLAMFHALAGSVLPTLNQYSEQIKIEIYNMAKERDTTLDSEHPLNIQFFDVLQMLNAPPTVLSPERLPRCNINHSKKPNELIAISITEIYRLAKEHGYDLPPQGEMTYALKQSRQYKFVQANKVTASRHLGRSIRCWIFEQNQAQPIT